MNSNIERLNASYIAGMQKVARGHRQTVLELGTINGNMSLSVDSLGGQIPAGDYLVSLHLTHDTYRTTKEVHHHEGGTHSQAVGSGYHTHDDGLHDHRVPSVFRRLQAGDRVLVAWAGHQAVVVDIVVPGTTVNSG